MTKAIAKVVEATEVAPRSPGLEIAPMIERIMTDPTLPMERVEQAFAFYQKVEADQARKAFTSSFAKMQPALPAIERKGKSHNAKYARWEDIAESIMPVLAKYGFGLSFRLTDGDKHIRVTCVLSHEGGHSEETSHSFPFDTSGGKNAIQAIGSASSYGKRYTATALLGIATRDEDDDGNKAFGTITDEQVAELSRLLTRTKSNFDLFARLYAIESLTELPAKQFGAAKALLVNKLAKGASDADH